MISSITGELRGVDPNESRARLRVGPVLCEVLVPAFDLAELQQSIGREITLHTILDLEGDPTRGNLQPRLIGFLRDDDRKFFNLFTTVKGIGPKTALRALTVPVGQIAQAIEQKDSRFLLRLSGIGKRTAELIIAELAGKAGKFAGSGGAMAHAAPVKTRNQPEEDALAVLMQLGERRLDAEHLLDRAKQETPSLQTTDAILREMLRLRTVRG